MKKQNKKFADRVHDCDYNKDAFAVFGVAWAKKAGEGYTILLDAVRMEGPVTARVISKPED